MKQLQFLTVKTEGALHEGTGGTEADGGEAMMKRVEGNEVGKVERFSKVTGRGGEGEGAELGGRWNFLVG